MTNEEMLDLAKKTINETPGFIKHNNYKVDGFECHHSSFTEEQIEYMTNYCKKHNLLMSGGSDCHGDNKPDISIAFGRGNLNISEKIIENWINN